MTTAESRVNLREELIFLLNQATELEHSLCCSYLFTAFTLKSKVEDGLPEAAIPVVKGWKDTFVSIAIEEMFHLTLINDLLVGLGAAPNFDRPNFPHGCSYYMPEVHIELHPFSEETMRHFVAIEQPTGGNLPFRRNPELRIGVHGARTNEIGPDAFILQSQGDVYDLVLEGLDAMKERIGEDKLFIGPPTSPALERFLTGSGWEVMRTVEAAKRNLARIVEEGEGGHADSANSHHARFTAILYEYLRLKDEYPGIEPAFPVLDNPFARTPPEVSGALNFNVLHDEFAVQVSDLFNVVYTTMLNLLARFFIVDTETDQQAGTLMNTSMMVMGRALAPLGELLVRLPAGEGHPNNTAGPSFVVGTMHPLPYKESAWFVLQERFNELAEYATKLSEKNDEAKPLLSVGQNLGRVAKMLR
ncbi:MAG: ferritin-like domain-containing protein [Dehalococcoidia bacterium]